MRRPVGRARGRARADGPARSRGTADLAARAPAAQRRGAAHRGRRARRLGAAQLLRRFVRAHGRCARWPTPVAGASSLAAALECIPPPLLEWHMAHGARLAADLMLAVPHALPRPSRTRCRAGTRERDVVCVPAAGSRTRPGLRTTHPQPPCCPMYTFCIRNADGHSARGGPAPSRDALS